MTLFWLFVFFFSFNCLRDYRCVAVKQRLFCIPLLVLAGSGHWYCDWMWRLGAQGKYSLYWLSSSKDTDIQIIWITLAETLPANSLFVSFLRPPFTCALFVCYICKSCLCLTGRSNLGVLAWMGQHQQPQWPAYGPADVSIRYLYIERDLQDTMIAISVISTLRSPLYCLLKGQSDTTFTHSGGAGGCCLRCHLIVHSYIRHSVFWG